LASSSVLSASFWRDEHFIASQRVQLKPPNLQPCFSLSGNLPSGIPKVLADITALRAEDITLREGHKIQFKEYRSPPAVSRGTCSSCGCPVVGFFSPVSFVRIAFVPAEIYPDQMVLPPPRMHIFYHRRRTDVSDTIAKYSGEWRSQLAAGLYIMFSMFRWSRRKKQDDHG
jgi:hypothetical protein